MNCQALSLIKESNNYYSHDNWLIKGDSKDKKDCEVKKTPNISTINYNSKGNN